jgi:hypothetical protein
MQQCMFINHEQFPSGLTQTPALSFITDELDTRTSPKTSDVQVYKIIFYHHCTISRRYEFLSRILVRQFVGPSFISVKTKLK